MSNSRTELAKLLSEPQFSPLFDVSLLAENKEIRAHRCILAANSAYFFEQFCGSPTPPARIEFPQQAFAVVKQLVQFLYGVDIDPQTPPDQIMEFLAEARALGINCVNGDDFAHLVVTKLTFHNCIPIFLHEELLNQPLIAEGVCDFVANHFFELIQNKGIREQLLQLHRRFVIDLFRAVSLTCRNDAQAGEAVRFAVEWSQLETACDLLKDCKAWPWNADPNALCYFSRPSDPSIMSSIPPGEVRSEWKVDRLRQSLRDNCLPAAVVKGHGFDWHVRIDHGAEGKIRIVYEAAIETEQSALACIKRFPAALFAWQVIYKDANVFCERPVFICFPQGVSLHWSTTLPITAAELSEDDSITILCSMAENPLVSLILHHFSSDLGTTMETEDILNRLPHIEYRCLSSYTLYQQARAQIQHSNGR